MDQNENKTGITPEDIMKEITSEETPAEVAEEVVAETVEETAEVVETVEEIAVEATEEVVAEAVEETAEVVETAEEVVAEVVEEAAAEAAEEVVAEAVEETAEVVETAEEVVAEVVEEVAAEAEEIAEETVEAVVEEPVEEQKTAFVYEVPSETNQNANFYGQYNEAPDYVYEPYQQNVGGEGICIAALVLGIVGFFLNPCYIVSLLAIIFGFFGQAKNNSKKAFAIWGWALGFAAIVLQILSDLLVSLFSGGVGLFVFCC